MTKYTKRTIKCPTCKKWTAWTGSPSDLCEYCGNMLDEEGFMRQLKEEDEEQAKKKKFNITLTEIYPQDSKLVVFFKRIVQALQITFMAILSFILWLIALLAG